MKGKLPGYYKKTQEELAELWKDAIFIFDTNFLLNFYRYSETSRNDVLTLLHQFHNRIWLPYHVAYEYNKNRFDVISAQESEYSSFKKRIKDFKEKLSEETAHPFLKEDLQNQVEELLGEVEQYLEEGLEEFHEKFKNDDVYNSLSRLFENNIGEPIDRETYQKLKKDGEERFSNGIPPGYKDKKRKVGNIYGDYIIWNEVLNKGKTNEAPVIFVTSETGEDWWWKSSDEKTIGPRPELIEEFYHEVGQDFHLYSSKEFYKHAKDYINDFDDSSFIEEGKPLEEMEGIIRSKEKVEGFKEFEGKIQVLNEKKSKIVEELNRISNKIDQLKEELGELRHKPLRTYDLYEKENDLNNQIDIYKSEFSNLLSELKEIEKEIESYKNIYYSP